MGLLSASRRAIRCRWCGHHYLWGRVRIPRPLRGIKSEPGICEECSGQLAREMDRCHHEGTHRGLLVRAPKVESGAAG